MFISLLLIGLVFRFLFIHFQGLSNDELSAWNRTQFGDWNSFWYRGVKDGDMHPVFYQGLLWIWVRLFGDSEWSLRSTGILFYILNSWLIYRISIRFFSKQAGLAVIALYTTLAFTIINTVFARPYNSGTFFLLLLTLSLFEMNANQRKVSFWHFGIILGFVGAMLSHYYAFLVAGIIGLLALFYLERWKIKDVVITGIISCLLFLPHWSVTQYQLQKGGLGWLSPPEWNWLIDFFHLFFNHSWIIFAFFILVAVLSLSKSTYFKSEEEKFVFRLFLVTYLAGHLISVYYTPVLRDLVMLYTLPFLLLFLFRGFQFSKGKLFYVSLIIIPLVVGLHSIYSVQLLRPQNFGVFRELGQTVNEADQKLGRKNLEFASNFNDIAYINYYYKQKVEESIREWSDPEVVYELAERAKNSQKPYFVYNWSNDFHIPMYYEVVRKHFPYVYLHHNYFNSASTIFSRQKMTSKGLTKRKVDLKMENTFPETTVSSEEFIGAIKVSAKQLKEQITDDAYVLIEAKGTLKSDSPCYLVATLERNGQMVLDGTNPVLYVAFDQSRLIQKGTKETFFCAFKMPEDVMPEDVIHIYLWNPEKQVIELEKPVLLQVSLQD